MFYVCVCIYIYTNTDKDIRCRSLGKMRVYGRKRGKERYV